MKKGDYSIKANAAGYTSSMPMFVTVKNKTECVIKLNSAPGGGPKENGGGSGPSDAGKASSYVSNVVAQEKNSQTQHTQTQPTQTFQQPPVQSATVTIQATSPSPSQQEPSEQQGWSRDRINQAIKTFQEKGAIGPETALTAKELGLSRMFVRIMEKRKGQTKIFIQINGKYNLNQKALEENKQ